MSHRFVRKEGAVRVFLALTIVAIGLAAPSAQTPRPPTPPTPPAAPAPSDKEHARSGDRVERPFVAGGQIAMELSAGGYAIEGWAEPRIRIAWTTRDPNDARAVKVRADVTGREARIVTDGPHNNFQVTINVPDHSNLAVELSAGECRLHGVHGHADVSAWAGKLTLDVAPRDEYRIIYASVTAGQIRAEPFQVTKGGLFRSFTWQGKGQNELRVRLTAGDIILETAAP
jgi:hypothetical protein